MKSLQPLKWSELHQILLLLGLEVEGENDGHQRYKFEKRPLPLRLTIPRSGYYVPENILKNLVLRLSHVIDEATLDYHFYTSKQDRVNSEFTELQIEHIRSRPGMYIGAKDNRALHTLLDWALASVIDQASSDHCTEVRVTIRTAGEFVVEDNGTWLPEQLLNSSQNGWLAKIVDDSALSVKSAHWGSMNYRIFAALGQRVSLVIVGRTKTWKQTYLHGAMQEPIQISVNMPDERIGTKLHFVPDPTVLGDDLTFNDADLHTRLHELAYLRPDLRITLVDERDQTPRRTVFNSSQGLAEFLRHINRDKTNLHEVIHGRMMRDEWFYPGGPKFEIAVDFACQFTADDTQYSLSYVNYDQTLYDGVHVQGMRSGVISPFISMAHDADIVNRRTLELVAEDFFPGFTGIIHLCTPYPEYCGQFRDQLTGDTGYQAAYQSVFGVVESFLQSNPDVLKLIVYRALERKQQRDSRRFGDWSDDRLPPVAKLR